MQAHASVRRARSPCDGGAGGGKSETGWRRSGRGGEQTKEDDEARGLLKKNVSAVVLCFTHGRVPEPPVVAACAATLLIQTTPILLQTSGTCETRDESDGRQVCCKNLRLGNVTNPV